MEQEQQNQERAWSPAQFRQRVVGASVVVALAVLLLPIWLDGSGIDALEIESAPASVEVSQADDIQIPQPDDAAQAVLTTDPAELSLAEGAVDDLAEQPAAADVEPMAPEEITAAAEAPSEPDTTTEPTPPADEQSSAPPVEQPVEQIAQAGESPAPSEPAPADPAPAEPAQTEPDPSETQATEPEPTDEPAANDAATAPEAEQPPVTESGRQYIVQLGSFSDELNANGLVENVENSGFEAFVEPLFSEQGTVWRVRMGPFASREQANERAESLRERIGRDGLIMRYE